MYGVHKTLPALAHDHTTAEYVNKYEFGDVTDLIHDHAEWNQDVLTYDHNLSIYHTRFPISMTTIYHKCGLDLRVWPYGSYYYATSDFQR